MDRARCLIHIHRGKMGEKRDCLGPRRTGTGARQPGEQGELQGEDAPTGKYSEAAWFPLPLFPFSLISASSKNYSFKPKLHHSFLCSNFSVPSLITQRTKVLTSAAKAFSCCSLNMPKALPQGLCTCHSLVGTLHPNIHAFLLSSLT
jgi:hypothetical protein